MTARSGMTTLITRWRELVGGAGTAVWTDDEAQTILDGYRVDLWGHWLTDVPQMSSGTVVYQVFQAGYPNFEEIASGTAYFRVHDANGSVIGTSSWTADYQRGILTFGTTQAGSARYLDGRSYDLNGAAAHGWRELAGVKAELYKFTADGASYDRNQWFDHCLQMANYYQSMATSAAGSGVNVGFMFRSDVTY